MSLSSDILLPDSVSLHLMEPDVERILGTGPLGQTLDNFFIVVKGNLHLSCQVIEN